MKFFFLLLGILSLGAYAESCSITDEMGKAFNNKHQDKVVIETSLANPNYSVTINLPIEVEGQSLYSVWLVSDSIEEPTFVAPLEIFYEGEHRVSWYDIDAGFTRKHFIVVSFGEGCMPSIIKEVFYH